MTILSWRTFSRRGGKVLFSLFGAGLIVGCGTTLSHQVSPLQGKLYLIYALPNTNRGETLWERSYTASGHPVSGPVRLGRLGLIAQSQIATGTSHGIAVTTGHRVVSIQNRLMRRIVTVPPGQTVLSIRFVQNRLYAVVENVTNNRVTVDRVSRGHSLHTVWAGLPLGITSIWVGPHQYPFVSIMRPFSALIEQIAPIKRSYPWLSQVAPQGTVGFSRSSPIVPFSEGRNGFGVKKIGRISTQTIRFSSVYQAAIEVTDTQPLWGLSPTGMVPYSVSRSRFLWSRLKSWPRPLKTTATMAGRGPWIVILDGPSQGFWFNVVSGHFGPSFQIKAPWRAVVRATVLSSSSSP